MSQQVDAARLSYFFCTFVSRSIHDIAIYQDRYFLLWSAPYWLASAILRSKWSQSRDWPSMLNQSTTRRRSKVCKLRTWEAFHWSNHVFLQMVRYVPSYSLWWPGPGLKFGLVKAVWRSNQRTLSRWLPVIVFWPGTRLDKARLYVLDSNWDPSNMPHTFAYSPSNQVCRTLQEVLEARELVRG